jgi:hypothetical protein
MTLTEAANGSTATTATETTINEITSDDLQYWGAMVFIPSAFTTGDTMEIKFYVYATAGTPSLESLYYVPLTGATSYTETAIYFPPVATKRYRLTFKRTGGTDRTFKWQIVKQTGG